MKKTGKSTEPSIPPTSCQDRDSQAEVLRLHLSAEWKGQLICRYESRHHSNLAEAGCREKRLARMSFLWETSSTLNADNLTLCPVGNGVGNRPQARLSFGFKVRAPLSRAAGHHPNQPHKLVTNPVQLRGSATTFNGRNDYTLSRRLAAVHSVQRTRPAGVQIWFSPQGKEARMTANAAPERDEAGGNREAHRARGSKLRDSSRLNHPSPCPNPSNGLPEPCASPDQTSTPSAAGNANTTTGSASRLRNRCVSWSKNTLSPFHGCPNSSGAAYITNGLSEIHINPLSRRA